MAMNFALVRRPRVRRRIGVQRRRRRKFRVSGRRRVAANRRTGGYTGIELKFRDNLLTLENFTTAWATKNPTAPNCLGAVDTGTGESNRQGRKCFIHGLYIKGTVDLEAAEGATAPYVDEFARICLVLDTQTNGAELTATDVMESPATDALFAFRKLENTARFKVLWDRIIRLPANCMAHDQNQFARQGCRRNFKIMKTFKPPLTIQYSATATPPTVAQITDTSLHIIGIASTSTAELSYIARFRFTG